MLQTSFVLFLATMKAHLNAPVARTLLNLLDEDKRGAHSVIFDLLSVSLWTKGAKAVHMVHVQGVAPKDDAVEMHEVGMLLDLFCRVIYPCGYTIFFATLFSGG